MHMCIKYAHAYYAFVYTALGHAALVHACIVIQGAAEAAAGRGSPPPPQGAGRASVVGLLRVLAPLVGNDEVKRARGARV